MRKSLIFLLIVALFVGCAPKEKTEEKIESSTTVEGIPSDDPHSFSVPEKAKVTHLDWKATIDFENKVIDAKATWKIAAEEVAEKIIFDTKDLAIEKTWVNGKEVNFNHGKTDDFLGTPLEIPITSESKSVSIAYQTKPTAAALQWLSPQQTADGTHPFLFTQSQAILARTWIPCQDSPGIRFTYNAEVSVPEGLLAIMSAENPTEIDPKGNYSFAMQQAIPSYLMALSVGKLTYVPLSDRTGVYAEPSVAEAAKFEFADTEKMVQAAEKLYGKYAWEIYDMVILPPSFPFGGMENPRLTFATPTIIAGDRSLTALVAHELAHSWSGNLVTNANWNDFWLNEGFTVYFERRIMEEVYGKKYAEMLAQLGYQDLQEELKELSEKPNDTKLKLALEGRDPDDGMTDIAYEKGYFLLRLIENTVGREEFDKFLNTYFEENKFKSITTESFITYLKEYFEGNEALASLNLNEWIYEPGIPENCPVPHSNKFHLVEKEIEKWVNGTPAASLATQDFTTHEWLHFLRSLPKSLTAEQLTDLDNAFGFTKSGNSEILAAWFQHTIAHHYEPANAVIDSFLVHVGRRKFLTPTYKALIKADPTKERALAIYQKARPNYHAVSTETMDELLGYKK